MRAITLIILAVVEVILVSYLTTPAKTQAPLGLACNWALTHRPQALAGTFAVVGPRWRPRAGQRLSWWQRARLHCAASIPGWKWLGGRLAAPSSWFRETGQAGISARGR